MLKRQPYQKIASYETEPSAVRKIVLLYSGSLYTSVLIPWLKKTYKANVIALIVDIGQKVDFTFLQKQAMQLGAEKVRIVDAKNTFATEYLAKAIKANAVYQGSYHMLSPLSRPLLAKIAVETAEQERASAIAHGCSAQSNDQIRIDGTVLTLNPNMKIIAPLREETLLKKDALQLAKTYKIPQDYQTVGYSYDDNLWGVSIIGGDIENMHIPSRVGHILRITTLPEKAPEVAERITIDFVKGVPVSLNDRHIPFVQIIQELNSIGGKHGVGLSYIIEDMILGLKNRSIDEEPAATILIKSHQELEKYVCTREENEFKSHIDTKWTYLCYEGKWYEPLMSDLEAYMDRVNEKVTGKVHIRLFKGHIEVISIQTHKTIFEKRLATAQNSGIVNHRAIAGYIELATLPMRLANRPEKTILLSIGQRGNKFKLLPELRHLNGEKYRLYATYKTHKFLKTQGINAILVNKIHQPHLQPNLHELLDESRFDLIIRIPSSKSVTKKESADSMFILQKAEEHNIPLITDMLEAKSALASLSTL